MMDGISLVFVLSGAMFLGSYSTGYIPLLFSMTESRMRVVSIFGAGLLVGTALSVIIPEGVETLYSIQNGNPVQDSANVRNSFETKSSIEKSNLRNGNKEHSNIIEENIVLKDRVKTGNSHRKRNADFRENDIVNIENVRIKRSQELHFIPNDGYANDHEGGIHTSEIHKTIGYSLVSGFIFMLLVDQIGSSTLSRNERSGRSRMGISATIGLVVHSAVDGIALGSASTINKSDVQLIVFVAIMLHKAPAAFGLVSFLIMEGIDQRNIRKHLIAFSSAAPFGAVITYLIISYTGAKSQNTSESSTGMLMLFSAGTFLYVATVHVLPELANHSKSSQEYTLVIDAQSPATAGHSHSGGASFTIRELLAIIGGAVVPAILASGHSH